MKKILATLVALFAFVSTSLADTVLVIDSGYSTVAASVVNRLQAAGHTATTVTTVPADFNGYQQVWDLRYATALTSTETTLYTNFVTNGGFVYFTTENPGCCMARNNSVAALITALGGGTTTIGANSAMTNNISSNVNTTYMTNGITVNYAAVSAIVNSQGIPLISDGSNAVSGMSWIGRAGALAQGVTGTIVTVADINWMDSSRMVIGNSATTAQQQNVTALDDIIRGIAAGTVAGTISASGNGAGSQQQQQQNQTPTVVSTAPGAPITSSSTTYGNTTIVNTVVDRKAVAGNKITVTRSTTPVSTRPYSTTVSTTPTTVTTYSDGSTVTTNGTTTTAVVNGSVITVDQTTEQSASVSAVGLKDAIAITRFNPFLIDAVSTKDGAWVTPLYGYAKTEGSFRMSSIGFGAQTTVEDNSFGIAGTFSKSNSSGFLNTKAESESYGATAYILNKQSDIWTKASVGFGVSDYNTTVSLPIFALSNSSKVKAKNYYADLTFYTGQEFYGFRPLVGATLNRSTIDSAYESGSPLLSTLPEKGTTTELRPYAGVRYDIDDVFGVEARAIRSKDFGTVGQIRATAKTEIMKDTFINMTAGFDKGSNYTAAVGMIGLRVNF